MSIIYAIILQNTYEINVLLYSKNSRRLALESLENNVDAFSHNKHDIVIGNFNNIRVCLQMHNIINNKMTYIKYHEIFNF